MSSELERWDRVMHSLRHVYRVFSRFKLRRPILCEMTDRVIVPAGVPLQERTAEDLDYYHSRAMTTLGTVDDFRHLLPRLLELSLLHKRATTVHRGSSLMDNPAIGLDMTAMKLEDGGVRAWPARQREALREFGIARWWWESTLPENWSSGGDAIFLLCVLGEPVCGLLDEALRSPESHDVVALARFMDIHIKSPRHGHPPRLEVEKRAFCDQADAVRQWFLAPQTREALERRFFDIADPAAGEEVSNVVTLLEQIADQTSPG